MEREREKRLGEGLEEGLSKPAFSLHTSLHAALARSSFLHVAVYAM
jgi:hypothetical protein